MTSNSVRPAPRADDPLVLEATNWLLRLRDEEVDPQVLAEWERWLAAEPSHRLAFARVQTLWEAMGQVEPVPWPTDAEVFNDRYSGDEPIAAWRAGSNASRHGAMGVVRGLTKRFAHRPYAAAACAVIALCVGALWRAEHGVWPTVLETTTAENRSFSLDDGSKVFLGGASRVTVALTAQHRSLQLDRGEAFFEVAKDPSRPFTVRAGSAEITAVGTAFDIRRNADGVLVAVAHGVVKIAAMDLPELPADSALSRGQLMAGQEAVLSKAGWSAPVAVNVPTMISWREGRLQYSSEPLRDVVAELTRYSDVPVQIADPTLGDVRVTATVFEGDLRGWLEGLEQALPVKVEFGRDKIVISRRQAAAEP
jgi:transmembrane sensor